MADWDDDSDIDASVARMPAVEHHVVPTLVRNNDIRSPVAIEIRAEGPVNPGREPRQAQPLLTRRSFDPPSRRIPCAHPAIFTGSDNFGRSIIVAIDQAAAHQQ